MNSSAPHLNHRHDEFLSFTAPINIQQHNPVTLPHSSLQRILSKELYSEQPNQTSFLVRVWTDKYGPISPPAVWAADSLGEKEREKKRRGNPYNLQRFARRSTGWW